MLLIAKKGVKNLERKALEVVKISMHFLSINLEISNIMFLKNNNVLLDSALITKIIDHHDML